MIAALTYKLKEDVYTLLESEGAQITPEQERNLKEQIVKREKNGQLQIKPFYQSLLKGVEYAFSNYALMHYIDYKIDKTHPGWQRLIDSLKIRNRITHPKKVSELEIHNDELVIIQSAGKWFIDTMRGLYEKCATSLFDRADALEKNWKIQHPNK